MPLKKKAKETAENTESKETTKDAAAEGQAAKETTKEQAPEKEAIKEAAAEKETTKEKAEETTQGQAQQESTKLPAVMMGLPEEKPTRGVFIMAPGLQQIVEDAEYGDFPPIVAANGSHSLREFENKVNLGESIDFHVVRADEVWKVSPGETDEAAKEFFNVSYDGVECKDGTPIEEALEEALDAGYAKAEIKQCMDVIIRVKTCEKEPGQEGELRTLQLATTSRRNWRKLSKNVQSKAALGQLNVNPIFEGSVHSAVLFKSTATESSGKYDFTFFEFSLV